MSEKNVKAVATGKRGVRKKGRRGKADARGIIPVYLSRELNHFAVLSDYMSVVQGYQSRSDLMRHLLEKALIDARLIDKETLEPKVTIKNGMVIDD